MSKRLRHFAVDLLTSSSGRFAALVLDVSIMGAAYLILRVKRRFRP